MACLKEFEGFTYTEYINKDKAYMIVQNWDKIFASLPKERQDKIKNQQEKSIDPLFYLKKIVKSGKDVIHTKYSFSKQLITYGRLFPNNASLASLPREVRNTIAGDDMYYDVDMKNCHPVLLTQYCFKNNIKCDVLDYYVANRDKVIESICEDNAQYNITPSTAKNTILNIINGGSGGNHTISKLPTTFLGKLKAEIKNIHKLVCSIHKDEFKKVQKRKDFNPEGTMMNIILCQLEHTLLLNAVKFMTDQGYNVDVLVFDGFMVRKNKDLGDVLDLLKNYIKEKTDYNMEFVVKSMNDKIDLSPYALPVNSGVDTSTYLKDKEDFEKTHIKITHPALYITTIKDKSVDIQSETALIASYRHMKTTIKNNKDEIIKTGFINLWINDENIKIYRSMVFIPNDYEHDKEDYNTWRGFDNEKVKMPDDVEFNKSCIERFKEFLHNLCNGEVKSIMYFIAWMANIVQNPSDRSCVCMVLYSLEEGVGKNMIIKTLEKVLGSAYVNYITDVANQLFGKHSAAEMNKLLVVMNEVKGKDTYANTDIFKTRITDDKREVELKGKDTMQMNNYANYIINTNNLNMVNAGEKDRRFCVIDCNNAKINDKKYFKSYEKEINNNPSAIKCIFEYLKSFNITEVIPDHIFSDYRPRTNLYEDLVECNKDREFEFLHHMVARYKEGGEDGEVLIFSKTIWRDYVAYCVENHHDITKFSSNRFYLIFKRSIVQTLDRTEKYKNAIRPHRDSTQRGYYFNISKILEYFEKK
jgi:hypothetical protein